MGRVLGNWLKAYSEYTEESESPTTYHMWVGLSTLASAIRRNVWLDQGIYLLYPNLYVVLIAPAGKVRKSTAMKLGQRLLKQVPDMHIGPDSVTREQLIKIMANSLEGNQSAVTLHSSEMSSIIEPSGIKMIQFLTDIYECDYGNPDGWKYSTKGQGKDTIRNPCLNFIACTTPSWIAEGLPIAATEHGFTSRTIFVYEDSVRKYNPYPRPPDPELVEALALDLEHISLIEGEFEWDPAAKAAYTDIYHRVRSRFPDDHRIVGYYARKDTHILKVAMLLALAEGDELILGERDIETAVNLLEMIETKMPRTFSAVGKYEFATDMERIYAQVVNSGGISRSELLDRNFHVGGPAMIEILSTLLAMNRIQYDQKTEVYRPIGSKAALGTGGKEEENVIDIGTAFDQLDR